MSRRQSREIALRTLFNLDFNESAIDLSILNIIMDFEEANKIKLSNKDKEFAYALVEGTRVNLKSIDEKIEEKLKDWKFSRTDGVDRNIIRLAIYELLYNEANLPPSILINEAIDLAKKYGSDKSAGFVNGVLDSMI